LRNTWISFVIDIGLKVILFALIIDRA